MAVILGTLVDVTVKLAGGSGLLANVTRAEVDNKLSPTSFVEDIYSLYYVPRVRPVSVKIF
jgi:hypothetical protein